MGTPRADGPNLHTPFGGRGSPGPFLLLLFMRAIQAVTLGMRNMSIILRGHIGLLPEGRRLAGSPHGSEGAPQRGKPPGPSEQVTA
jgi:hypothetical protein